MAAQSNSITMRLVEAPIEDHPLFSKPDVRFRHARIRKRFRKLKAAGINTFLRPEMVTQNK